MAKQANFPEEIQLVKNRALRITSKKTIEELEGLWSDSLLTMISGSINRSIEFCGDYKVLLYGTKKSNSLWPILDRHMGRTGKLIDLANGVCLGSEDGFRAILGLEERGDGFDDLRREEGLALSAALQGYISFRPDNPADVNSVKSHRYPSPSDQLVRYVLGRATRPYEDLLSIAKPCERPELQTRVDLDNIKIPKDLIRADPQATQALAEEIAAHGGLINPITVAWVSRGTYRLVAGRRRYAAYKLLGWPSIPVRIIAGDEAHLISTQIIENDARLDMDPFTRADAYMTLQRALEAKAGQCSNKDLAEALGVTPQKVSEVLKLMELPETLREQVRELGLGHRATVDVVRDLTKAETPEKVLAEITAQKTKRPAEESDGKNAMGKMRRKAFKFEQDGFELSVKSPYHEPPSTEVLIAKLEAFIKRLKADGQS